MKCLLILTLTVACLNAITSLAVDSDDHLKPKLEDTRSNKEVKEAVKTVVKRNAEVTNPTTPGASNNSTPPTTQPPVQKSVTLTPQQLADLVGTNKETKGPDYTNVFAVLSGGGLVSVAKAIQTLFVKSKKKKKGKKRDSESNSDSEEDGRTHTVAVKIEMNSASQTHNTPSKTAVPEIKAIAMS